MANDVFDAHTIGGLDNSKRGLGVRVMHLAGELTGMNDTGTYTVDADGVITAADGGVAADLVMDNGAGCIITVTDFDADGAGVGLEGAAVKVKFTFGSAVETSETQVVLGGFMSAGFDLTGGTVGSASVDALTFASLDSISGNSITFNIAAAYEQEGGTQQSLSNDAILSFSVLAFAKGGAVA